MHSLSAFHRIRRTHTSSWYHEDINTYEAWDRTMGDSDLVIAVIDDGFDLDHPEFRGKVYKPRNIPSQTAEVNTGYNSLHGTHVAGIAVAIANNGIGLAGVAPGCQLMPVQVADYYGRLSATAIIDGVLYAIHNGADVINVSLGMKPSPRLAELSLEEQQELIKNAFKEEETFWESIFEMAKERNIMIVLAAGNDDVLVGLDPMKRSHHAIKVSASDIAHRKAPFSNFGALSTVTAPGVAIYSTLPNEQFDYRDGTSMAAPMVAGSVALIKSINPTYTNQQLIELLQKTGAPVADPQKKMGNIIQLDQAIRFAENDRRNNYQVGCPSVQEQIDSLLLLVEKLRQQCPLGELDTLRLPQTANDEDFSFALGRWMSTTKIINVNTEEPLEVWFDFYADGTGRIELVEPDGSICTSSLLISRSEVKLQMAQLQSAVCAGGGEYTAYDISCAPDANGRAVCFAKNKKDAADTFEFYLVRTHNVLN
ncbi:MAG: S8 family serine peptidase [Bacteroidota bacterium]